MKIPKPKVKNQNKNFLFVGFMSFIISSPIFLLFQPLLFFLISFSCSFLSSGLPQASCHLSNLFPFPLILVHSDLFSFVLRTTVGSLFLLSHLQYSCAFSGLLLCPCLFLTLCFLFFWERFSACHIYTHAKLQSKDFFKNLFQSVSEAKRFILTNWYTSVYHSRIRARMLQMKLLKNR